MTIKADIVDGNDGRKGRQGWELSRIATVSGISPLLNGYDKVAVAVGEIEMTDVIGSPHPSTFLYKDLGAGLVPVVFLESFEPMSLATDVVKIRIIYREFPFNISIYQVGATASQVTTNQGFLTDDSDPPIPEGSLTDITVGHLFPGDYKDNPVYAGQRFDTGAEATKYIPERSITVTKQEVTTGDAVSALAKDYVGKTNSLVWDFQASDGVREWLCTGITGISNDNGVTYVITYTFQYRADRWDQTVVYIDPNTGRPPTDLVLGRGKKLYAMQEQIDFNGLGLV